ncbi:MAG: TetR/AcrR family transcriptional regulator [Gammaproteobacteria bacterium]|nr:TetR/AcrR family transcriptional regulator [Gammaproteobacteria bacterium]
MGLAARRERERYEIREKILDAARKLMAERGYDGVTMREIARRIEYSPTVIYSHFRDKQALIDELVDEDYRTVGKRLRDLSSIRDPIRRLRFIGEKITEFALANSNHYRAIAMAASPEVPERSASQNARGDVRADAHALVLQTVQEAVDQHRLREDLRDAELVTQTFLGGIHGIMSMHLTMGNDNWVQWRSVQARSRLMIEAMLRGFMCSKECCD